MHGNEIGRRPPPPTNRRAQQFDDVVRALAPAIAEIRKAGYHHIWQIAAALDEKGLRAPNGRYFAYETVRKILHRLKALGLGQGPLTKSDVMLARHAEDRAERANAQEFGTLDIT